MSPLSEYEQPNTSASMFGENSSSPNEARTRNRLKFLEASVADYESIYRESTIADAIREFMAPRSSTVTTPAASPEALLRLPHARILPWHKEKEADDTRMCGVCCDPLVLGVILTRLPCGHIYHLNCVIPWLCNTCTCPECRYELKTRDARYEVGRKQRMKDRAVVSCDCVGMHHCFFPNDAR